MSLVPARKLSSTKTRLPPLGVAARGSSCEKPFWSSGRLRAVSDPPYAACGLPVAPSASWRLRCRDGDPCPSHMSKAPASSGSLGGIVGALEKALGLDH